MRDLDDDLAYGATRKVRHQLTPIASDGKIIGWPFDPRGAAEA
jgi:hypothetical protein